MESTEKLEKRFFEFNPLTCNRFIVSLPEKLDINEFYIKGFNVNTHSYTISVEVIETVEKNIRDSYYNYEDTNALIKGGDIVIEYLNERGSVVRKEKYSDVSYLGQEYGGGNYDSFEAIKTSLVFRYGRRENVATN